MLSWIGMLFAVIIGPTYDTACAQILQANPLAQGIEMRLDLMELTETEKEELTQKTALPVIFNSGESFLQFGSQTLFSYHNFEETPQDLQLLFSHLPQADIYKIATMAHSTLDALKMLLFVQEKSAQGIKLCGICMGEKGQVSRILSPIFGSYLNYAAIDQQSAPGQLKLAELKSIYHYDALNKDTAIYGLIGDPTTQSPSHITHNQFFREQGINAVYVKMQIAKEELASFFSLAKKLKICGLSVTIPLKELVLPFLDEIDPVAQEIGAVNTIVFEKGKMKGYNTDAAGALDAIEAKMAVKNKTMVLLGAGGSAKAIAYEAKRRGAFVTVVARRLEQAEKIGDRALLFEAMEEIFCEGYDILINCTPEANPIDPKHLCEKSVVMDINTKQRDTPFLTEARHKQCTIVYGIEMFINQAQGQFKLWFPYIS